MACGGYDDGGRWQTHFEFGDEPSSMSSGPLLFQQGDVNMKVVVVVWAEGVGGVIIIGNDLIKCVLTSTSFE